MKKFIAMLVALAIAFVASFALASPAAATPGHDDDNKKVTICHANNGVNGYTVNTVDVASIVRDSGHDSHEGDIIPVFTYTTVGGETVTYPGKNLDKAYLLDLDPKCVEPVVDEELVVPAANYADPCGTEDDVFTVNDGVGYSVGPVVQNNDGTQSITVTADEGFTFPNGQDSVTITKPGFTNVDCDLPETGSKTTNVVGGIVILALLGALGFYLLRRRNTV